MKLRHRGHRGHRGPRALTLTIALAGAIAAGCGGTSSPAGGSGHGGPEKTHITVGVLPIIDNAAFYIAQRKGLFAAQGLDATPLVLANGTLGTQLLLPGRLDFAFSNYVTTILSASHGTPLRVVADGHQATPGNVVIVVPRDSPLRAPQDLRGKTIAVNALANIGPLLVDATLARYGVPRTAVKIVAIPFPQMAAALAGHTVDAAWMTEPFLTEAEKTGARALADTATGQTADFPIAGWETTQRFAQQDPKTVAAFQRAITQAQALAASPSAVQQVLPGYIKGVTPQLASSLNLGAFPVSVSQARLQRVADLMLAEGMLQKPFNTRQLLGSG
jgi:NitT/TauT family transport system substrate-binding protein